MARPYVTEDPLDERGGLPGASAGVDEQRRLQVVTDALASRLIDQPMLVPLDDGHPATASGSTKPTYRATTGSWRLRSQRTRAVEVPRPSGSQYQHETWCSQPVPPSGCCGNCPPSMPSAT